MADDGLSFYRFAAETFEVQTLFQNFCSKHYIQKGLNADFNGLFIENSSSHAHHN